VAAVRACAAELLNVILRIDADSVFEFLPGLVQPDPRVAGTLYGRRLLLSMTRVDFSRIAPLLDELTNCGDAEAEFAAGEAQGLYSVLADETTVNPSEHSSAAVRRGAAAVLAANLYIPEYADRCSGRLVKMFWDGEEGVRDAAAACFDQFGVAHVKAQHDLCLSFVRSPAYQKNSQSLLRRLADMSDAPVDIVVEAADQFVRKAGIGAGDIRQAAAADASTVSVLLVRACSQNPAPEVKEQALNAIDRMLEVGAFGIEESVESYERL
jgi:hypothetical protein